jgi:methylated-DNA-[protein]-cysteine S-methyltransferase
MILLRRKATHVDLHSKWIPRKSNAAIYYERGAMFYKTISSSFGEVGIIWKWKGAVPSVARILLPKEDIGLEEVTGQHGYDHQRKSVSEIEKVCARISAYMKGQPVEFSLSLLDLDLCYEFQRKALLLAGMIPRGRVSPYGGLALKVGVPGAARAVGTAMARNPFPILLPCHRVVRSDGSLGGFGGGIKMKRALLEMEGVRFDSKGRAEEKCFW